MPSIPRDNGENETGKDVEGSLAAFYPDILAGDFVWLPRFLQCSKDVTDYCTKMMREPRVEELEIRRYQQATTDEGEGSRTGRLTVLKVRISTSHLID